MKMVKRFHIAALNRRNVTSEAKKRFKDRGYSKCVIQNYKPLPSKAKFLRREKGFSIYSIPVVKKDRNSKSCKR